MSNHGPGTSTAGVQDPLIGRVLAGRYTVQELVAKGGMGRIYRAEQAPLGRTVAIKVLATGHGEDETFRERFFREASISSRLRHPNTVRIFDYGNEGDTFFIVMELLQGRTLTQVIRDEGPMPPARVIALARQICRSLGEAHSQGVIHRDLKPGNIFLSQHADEEHVKVLDFGLVTMEGQSRVTQAGKILGSPMYMAPEQVLGQAVSSQTDVYALGMVMYAMITRTLPFKREHPMAVLNAQVNAPLPTFRRIAPELEVPSNLEWVVRACLEKSHKDRFATMGQVERALKLCQRYDDTLELSLDTGQLVVPEGVEDSSLDHSASISRPAHLDQAALPELASSPTLAQKSVRPAIEFVIAALVMLFLLTGAAFAVGVGWYVGTMDRGEVATVPAGPSDAGFPVQSVDPVEPVEAPTASEEPAASEEPTASKPTASKPTATKPTAAKPTAAKPSVVDDPAPPEEPLEPSKEDDADPPEEWKKPSSDLRNPWAE